MNILNSNFVSIFIAVISIFGCIWAQDGFSPRPSPILIQEEVHDILEKIKDPAEEERFEEQCIFHAEQLKLEVLIALMPHLQERQHILIEALGTKHTRRALPVLSAIDREMMSPNASNNLENAIRANMKASWFSDWIVILLMIALLAYRVKRMRRVIGQKQRFQYSIMDMIACVNLFGVLLFALFDVGRLHIGTGIWNPLFSFRLLNSFG